MHSFQVTRIARVHPLSATTGDNYQIEAIEPISEEEVLAPEYFLKPNESPFFLEPPKEFLEITKTVSAEDWSYTIPETSDLDEDDSVTISVSLGETVTFVSYDEQSQSLTIADLSSDQVPEGSFSIKVTLDDSKDQVDY